VKRTTLTTWSRVYFLDGFGFLDPPCQWNEEFSQALAAIQGTPGNLNGEHWRFIDFLRRVFKAGDAVPFLASACRKNRLKLGRFRALFPGGYYHGACRIAGLTFPYISRTNPLLSLENRPVVDTEFEVTDSGFLADFDRWNELFARKVASDWELPCGLTEAHWKVIHFLRDYFRFTGTVPAVTEVCTYNGMGEGLFRKLFPSDFRRDTCRAAGLPREV
jgi:tRNA 2-thiouridine synthesizing protein E